MTALDDANPRECLDCGRTDGGCDRIAVEPTNPTTEAREALAEFDKTPNDMPRKAQAAYDCVNALRALIEENERLRAYKFDAENLVEQVESAVARAEVAEAKLAALEAQPEPEWEYGERSAITPGHVWGPWPKDLAAPPGSAVRRRKAGPWEPVPDTRSNT